MTRHPLYLPLSLLAPLYYGLMTLHYVFSHEFIVQDDMRQHVVWFQQFVEPDLFQNDAIAHYFRSVAPLGVTAVYKLGAQVGIEPLVLAKLLPLPLALIATVYLFYTTLLIVPVPLAAWLTTLIFNQQLWLNDDLVSATPRAFVYPLFAAFLYYSLRRSPLPTLGAIALLGLFFPQMMLVAVAMLMVPLVTWERGRFRISRHRQRWKLTLSGLAVAIAILLPFMVGLSENGPAVTAEQMRSLPEYGPGGRNAYFGLHPLDFALNGGSGLRIPVFPSIIWAGFALPFLGRWRSPPGVAFRKTLTPQVWALAHLGIASLGLYFLAHLLLLQLHFPSRYTYHSWRFGLSIAAGLVLAALVEWGIQAWRESRLSLSHNAGKEANGSTGRSLRAKAAAAAAVGAIAVVVGVPLIPPLVVAFQGWVVGELPQVYAYLAQQPADIQVASLAPEASNIPAFAHRSAWVGREFALPHHPRYYAVIQSRLTRILEAQYSSSPDALRSLVDEDGVDFLLIEQGAFDPAYLQQDWLLHSSLRPAVLEAIAQLEAGATPAILPALPSCAVVRGDRYRLADAKCLVEATQ